MDNTELECRTKRFALQVINFVGAMSKSKVGEVIGYQLMKSGTSIGANYREANRAESRNDFIHQSGIAEKEAAETQYWLELCHESDIGDTQERLSLLQESASFSPSSPAAEEPPR